MCVIHSLYTRFGSSSLLSLSEVKNLQWIGRKLISGMEKESKGERNLFVMKTSDGHT
jgi:hypothetical protein